MNDKKEYETLFDRLREIILFKDKQIFKLEEENTKLRMSLSEYEKKKNYEILFTSEGNEIQGSSEKKTKEDIIKSSYNTIETGNTASYKNINVNAVISGKIKENEKDKVKDNYTNNHIHTHTYNHTNRDKYFSNGIKMKSDLNVNFSSETQRNINKPKDIIYTPSCGLLKSPNKNENKSYSHSKVNESTSSRIEIKSYLQEVKEKISVHNFKQFIKYIKILTDKNGVIFNRSEIFENVKFLFGNENKELYTKFEHILSIKN